ncbi:ATP phosphoribosyltransferase [Malassezia obtusa]|uniref:ATP phosphoribosyltransferase n=1 Tax=Malassezia obtusa TaxID=76774 RepID=A0AAF0IUY3_9BASI|nr:ATP phosphoribosyltransferase [Malassezia obtusa]
MSQLLRPENLKDRLLFAIPKKADIPHFVANGDVDLGITGHDMVQEAGPAISDAIQEELALGFGNETIKTVEDLVGKKIATSFDHLSAKYFRELEEKTGSQKQTEIAYLNGSVETACALGLADGIVDLVESGETMRACGLKPIATLLASEAKLIKPKTPHARSNTALISLITARIRGVIAASKYVLCQYNIPKVNLQKALAITPGRRAATVSTLEESDWNAVSSMVSRDEVATIMDKLEDVGASDILILSIDNCRV